MQNIGVLLLVNIRVYILCERKAYVTVECRSGGGQHFRSQLYVAGYAMFEVV